MIKNRIGLDLRWNPKAWRQYTSLIYDDKKYVKKINRLIKSIHRDGHRKGIGEPEPLTNLKWYQGTKIWSRRITAKDRLVYIISASSKIDEFRVSSCKYHYKKGK